MSPPPLPARQLPGVPGSAYWRGWPEVRQDLRTGRGLLGGLILAGVPVGVLWWLLAPRADYRVTEAGPVPVGTPPLELQVGDDVVLAFVLLGFGALAGAGAWLLRRGRGVGTLLLLAVGTSVGAVVAWQTGELLAPPPGEAVLSEIGAQVTTGLRLASLPVLAAAPFAASLVYVACALMAADDGLGRHRAPSEGSPRAGEG